ncbi:alkaline phosphatase 12 [Anticarsia gemmatalis]|uniref:alkaline phosphatase 12 n=1 Tax=Anticarsia gemmatalis TaxID=129554 RepID=UPI003F75C708
MRLQTTLVLCAVVTCARALRTDQQYWSELAENELNEALQVKLNYNTAKNVILFIGDGMGPNTVTATRIYKGGESHRLVYEKFPHMGLLKTYAANKMVPDSACSATALFSGIKTNKDTMGVDATVQRYDCEASLKPEARPVSLASLALKAGKSAGIITTMRVTHATPAAMYAHSAERGWECEAKMPAGTEQCKDIARQLIEDFPGKDLQVIMGGGMQGLVTNSTAAADDPFDYWGCLRQDGRNLVRTYKEDKTNRGFKPSVVTNNKELGELDVENTDYLLGVFANGHLKYDHERDTGPNGMPSISDMVEAAIKVLRKNDKGYFLMVEGGNIDMAHHRSWAKRAIDESAAMEAAVDLAANMTDAEDTLLIVTSDHTHTLSINGYPERGTNVFDIAEASSNDGINYTTLSYSTGGPETFQYYVVSDENGHSVRRRDPSLDDTQQFDYHFQAGIRLKENSHGGGDVAIYARGPHAHLFHNVHEQHYVYYAISYAAKLGAYSSAASINASLHLLSIVIVAISVFKL